MKSLIRWIMGLFGKELNDLTLNIADRWFIHFFSSSMLFLLVFVFLVVPLTGHPGAGPKALAVIIAWAIVALREVFDVWRGGPFVKSMWDWSGWGAGILFTAMVLLERYQGVVCK